MANWGGWEYNCEICGGEMNVRGQIYHTSKCPYSDEYKEKEKQDAKPTE